MTKDERRRRKVMRASQPLLEKLGLWQTYDVQFNFVTKVENGVQQKDYNAIGTVDNHYPYRRLVITLARWFVDSYDRSAVRRMVLHEVLHEVLYGWVRHHYTIGEVEIRAEENHVTLVEEWLLEHVDV